MESGGQAALYSTLRRIAPFTDAELELIAPALKVQSVAKGRAFAEEGKIARMAGVVLSGCMRHYYTHDGEEKTTYFYFEGDLVAAYISCIQQRPSLLTIEAITDCEVLTFPYAQLTALFAESHAWEHFGRRLSEYLAIGLEERMVTLLTLNAEERYRLLLKGGKEKILARIPQHYIASYLGITPVSLSRIRHRVAQG